MVTKNDSLLLLATLIEQSKGGGRFAQTLHGAGTNVQRFGRVSTARFVEVEPIEDGSTPEYPVPTGADPYNWGSDDAHVPARITGYGTDVYVIDFGSIYAFTRYAHANRASVDVKYKGTRQDGTVVADTDDRREGLGDKVCSGFCWEHRVDISISISDLGCQGTVSAMTKHKAFKYASVVPNLPPDVPIQYVGGAPTWDESPTLNSGKSQTGAPCSAPPPPPPTIASGGGGSGTLPTNGSGWPAAPAPAPSSGSTVCVLDVTISFDYAQGYLTVHMNDYSWRCYAQG